MSKLMTGNKAPDFSLPDQNGKPRTLTDFQGQWLILYFYPKDDTPGCTKEACTFRDDIAQFHQLGATIAGISLDSPDTHKQFEEKYSLPFPLLADQKGEIARQYGSLWKLGPLRFARRHTVLINPEGRIAKIYRSVKPASHSQEIINDLKKLQGEFDSNQH